MKADLTIAFDASCLGGARPTGVERSFLLTLAAFRELQATARMLLYTPSDLHPSIGDLPRGLETRRIPDRMPRAVWREFSFARELEREHVDLLWTPTTALPRRCSTRTVATVHEVPPFAAEESALRALRQRRARRLLRARADRVVVPSRVSEARLLRESPSLRTRTHIVPQPIAPRFLDARLGCDRGTGLLFVGAYRKRKNLERIARAWTSLPKEFRARHSFTWVGVGPMRFAERAGIECLGPRADSEVFARIRACRALILASTSEGFGVPALEALACGRIPIVARGSATEEVCAALALACDPHDEAAIAQAVRRALEDDDMASRIATAGPEHAATFTAQRSARAWQEIVAACSAPSGRGAHA